MRMLSNFRLLPAIALIGATTGGFNAQSGAEDAIVIGLLLPPEEAQASSLRQGALLGADQASDGAAIKARVVIRGRIGQWGADAVEAARMVLDDGVQGLIAPPDGAASHLALQVSGRTAVPVVSLCPDASVTQTGVPWMVRAVPRTIDEAGALFTGLHTKTGPPTSRWVALVPEGRVGREITRDLNAAAVASDCSLSQCLEVKSPLTKAESVRDLILKTRPDTILVWLDPDPAGHLVQSLRAGGFSGLLAGPGRLRSAEFTNTAGDALEGFLVPSPILGENDKAVFQHFASAFRNRFGDEPDAMASLSYDAARVLVHILQGAVDRPPRQAFPAEFSLPGASGNLAFDSQGNRKVTLELLEARRGSFVPIASEEKPIPSQVH